MTLASTKAFASLIVAVMSFLGWSPSEYSQFLSPAIQAELPQTVSPSEASTTATTSEKTVKPKTTTPPKKQTPSSTVLVTVKPTPVVTVVVGPVTTPSQPMYAPPQTTPPKISATPTSTPVTNTTPSQIQTQPQSLTTDQKIKAATINILCTMTLGNQIAHYTGSGVMIDSSGVILTNAHVAEHVLLEEAGRESCSIRTGSPAFASYKAKVVYIPSAWVQSNRGNLSQGTLTGNGENDYAILVLTERIAKNAPDVPVPFLTPSNSDAFVNQSVTLAGYPLVSQSVSALDSALYNLEEPSTIKNVAGYDGHSADVIDTAPTPLAEHGSSGGAIVASDGTLVGIMDATVSDAMTGGAAIQGITLFYIKRSLSQNGKNLSTLISNARSEADSFQANSVTSLAAML